MHKQAIIEMLDQLKDEELKQVYKATYRVYAR